MDSNLLQLNKAEFIQPGGGAFRKRTTSRSDISHYSGFLLDIDGVLLRNEIPIKGASEFLVNLKKYGCPAILLTNECKYTNLDLSKRLSNIFGHVSPSPDEIYSSANSTKDFFERLILHGYNKDIYVIGEKGLIENVRAACHHFSNTEVNVLFGDDDVLTDRMVGYVVIGSVFSENTRYIEKAANFLKQHKARLVYTCPDLFEKNSEGDFIFGTPRSTVFLLEHCCEVESYNLGKPNPHMLRMAQSKLLSKRDIDEENILFIGDSLNTDIMTAIENGIDCALVMGGATNLEEMARSALKPNYVFQDISDLNRMFFCDKTNSLRIEKKFSFESL